MASEKLSGALQDMLEAGEQQGYIYFVASAYRSAQRQQVLIDNDVNKYVNQGLEEEEALEATLNQLTPAGYSEYQIGLALDIVSSENLELSESQEDTPGNQWLRKNCMKYGFILRYPKNKTKITEIDYEPWHFRYVGKEAAEFIMKNNMTLEEFIELAK